MLRLAGVSHRRDGKTLLDHVTLSVRAGDVVVLEGARGAGKSTLLAIAAGVLRPEKGGVFIGDKDIVALQRQSLPFVRRNVGYLPPDPPLVRHETALENVMLALAVRGDSVELAAERAQRALAGVGIQALAGELVSYLSLGERRLVALARALAGAPALIVLDEPGAALAPEDRDAAIAAISAAQAGNAAVLCASADEAFVGALCATGAERVRLEDGRLVGVAPRIALVSLDNLDKDEQASGLRALDDDDDARGDSEHALAESDLQAINDVEDGT